MPLLFFATTCRRFLPTLLIKQEMASKELFDEFQRLIGREITFSPLEATMSDALPVHTLLAYREIPSSHGEGILYYVFAGYVNWNARGGSERLALAVFMEYGGKVHYQMAAHIMNEDFDAVMEALQELRREVQGDLTRAV